MSETWQPRRAVLGLSAVRRSKRVTALRDARLGHTRQLRRAVSALNWLWDYKGGRLTKVDACGNK